MSPRLTAPCVQASGARCASRVQALLDMLKAAQAWDALVADEAGALVTEALHLFNSGLQDETTWQQLLDQMMLDGGGFGRWVHEVLENTTFRPAAGGPH